MSKSILMEYPNSADKYYFVVYRLGSSGECRHIVTNDYNKVGVHVDDHDAHDAIHITFTGEVLNPESATYVRSISCRKCVPDPSKHLIGLYLNVVDTGGADAFNSRLLCESADICNECGSTLQQDTYIANNSHVVTISSEYAYLYAVDGGLLILSEDAKNRFNAMKGDF